ncbi:MAG: biopolymer transporter ExbD [Geminicoccaceae bacterium]
MGRKRGRSVAAPARRMGEPTLPLINVVFLLLIFVLLTSVIETPSPVDVELADSHSAGEFDPQTPTLFVSSGDIASETAILAATDLQAWVEEFEPGTVSLRADRNLSASRLFAHVRELQRLGVENIELVVTRP